MDLHSPTHSCTQTNRRRTRVEQTETISQTQCHRTPTQRWEQNPFTYHRWVAYRKTEKRRRKKMKEIIHPEWETRIIFWIKLKRRYKWRSKWTTQSPVVSLDPRLPFQFPSPLMNIECKKMRPETDKLPTFYAEFISSNQIKQNRGSLFIVKRKSSESTISFGVKSRV